MPGGGGGVGSKGAMESVQRFVTFRIDGLPNNLSPFAWSLFPTKVIAALMVIIWPN